MPIKTQLRPELVTELTKAGVSPNVLDKLHGLQVATRAASTPISNLGFSKDLIAKLPADCQNLTKADLVSLGGWSHGGLTAAAAKLSASDISAIKNVLGGSLAGGLKAGMDINCCCCPCCCATAITDKKVIAKPNAKLVG